MGQETARLYRALLKEAAALPAGAVRRKLSINIRQLFDFYKHKKNVDVSSLQEDALAAQRVLSWVRALPKVGLQIAVGFCLLPNSASSSTPHPSNRRPQEHSRSLLKHFLTDTESKCPKDPEPKK
jgi:hypothetical protein